VKTLERSFKFLLDCQQPLKALTSQLTDDATNDITIQDEAVKLATIIESRLQATLLNLIRNSSTPGRNRYMQLYLLVVDIFVAITALNVLMFLGRYLWETAW